MNNRIRTMLGISAAAITALVWMAAPARAAGNTQITAVGRLAQEGECTELASFITMKVTGDLVGCWYTPVLEAVQTTPSGVYRERGAETFIGCLADGTTCGTFDTTYQFEARYAVTGAELFGHCEHPIVSGTGDFEGVKGRVNMKDDVETGEFNFTGHIALPSF